MAVIDGTGYVLGRVSTQIAKKLLAGETIALINSEKLIISGDLNSMTEKYNARRRVKNKMNPENSPKWPRVPYLLVRRIIRGMLPYPRKRGKEAYQRLRVYNGAPEGMVADTTLENAKPISMKKSSTVLDLCTRLGFSS
jgi:large subunit ribosomal protein L13